MAWVSQLPKRCCIESKTFVIEKDYRQRSRQIIISEQGTHKSFSIYLHPESIEWVREKTSELIKWPRNQRFFKEQRHDSYTLWIEKTSNRRGYTAELFKLDHNGRKIGLLIPAGIDHKGWEDFKALLTFKTPTNRQARQDKAKNQGMVSKSLPTHNHTYAEIVGKNIATESIPQKTYPSSSTIIKEALEEDYKIENQNCQFNWSNTIIISRRFFHDDWESIFEELKRSIVEAVAYNPFHADKALLAVRTSSQAKDLCNNRGWVTIGRFHLKFEFWNQMTHSIPSVIPSYGGWIKVRGIPLHLWNEACFKYIGDSCGGFIETGFETHRALNLIEAQIKIRENYRGFVPAVVGYTDEDGAVFRFQIVSPANGKWFSSRHPKVHGTFSRSAAAQFDLHNQKEENFFFKNQMAQPSTKQNTDTISGKIGAQQRKAINLQQNHQNRLYKEGSDRGKQPIVQIEPGTSNLNKKKVYFMNEVKKVKIFSPNGPPAKCRESKPKKTTTTNENQFDGPYSKSPFKNVDTVGPLNRNNFSNVGFNEYESPDENTNLQSDIFEESATVPNTFPSIEDTDKGDSKVRYSETSKPMESDGSKLQQKSTQKLTPDGRIVLQTLIEEGEFRRGSIQQQEITHINLGRNSLEEDMDQNSPTNWEDQLVSSLEDSPINRMDENDDEASSFEEDGIIEESLEALFANEFNDNNEEEADIDDNENQNFQKRLKKWLMDNNYSILSTNNSRQDNNLRMSTNDQSKGLDEIQ